MDNYIVLGCGASEWDDMALVHREIKKLKTKHGNKLLMITGGASGADTMIKLVCNELSIHCAVMTALWSTRHRSAGPQRNTAMGQLVGWERLDLVLAFHHDIAKSKGTKDMIKQAKKKRVYVKVCS